MQLLCQQYHEKRCLHIYSVKVQAQFTQDFLNVEFVFTSIAFRMAKTRVLAVLSAIGLNMECGNY